MQLDAEEWRPVIGQEGRYEVSSLGRVRSMPHTTIDTLGRARRFPGQLLKPTLTDYPTHTLHHGPKVRVVRAHILVMEAFVGPKPPSREIRHRNGIATDCSLSNLVYGSHSENMDDSVAHGTHFQAGKTRCKNDHAFTPENTGIDSRGWRFCRACQRDIEERRRGKRSGRRYPAREKARGVSA